MIVVEGNSGLLEPEPGDDQSRIKYLRMRAGRLKKKLNEQKGPVLKGCVLDVFGFSRGAAEARVFCTWLLQLVDDGKLCGVPLTIRFLGIFDTVASTGLGAAAEGAVTKENSGHGDWARVESLRIHKSVGQCVHMIAMHEIRKNFPLDEAAVNGKLPPNTIELAYPGSHSDVGGGYAPGELGVSGGSNPMAADSTKLSQIPLNHMYACAIAAGVPLNKGLSVEKDSNFDPFVIHPDLQSAYTAFLKELGPQPRRMYEWMHPYLSWRWEVRKTFTSLLQYRAATENDRKLLHNGNRRLVWDGEMLATKGKTKEAEAHRQNVLSGKGSVYDMPHTRPALELAHLDDEAPVVLKDAMAHPVSKVIADFFDRYVHDSLAGFGLGLEPTGYWRYRKAFQGTERVLFAENDTEDRDRTAS